MTITPEMTNLFENGWRLCQKSRNFLRNVNLFPSVPPSTNEFHLRNERLSTRLFIISLVLSLVILITYTSFVDVVQISDVNAPTLTQYSYLYSKYSNTLTCPCTKVSIMNKRFLQVNYTLHQVCSSIFVRNDWITYLAENRDNRMLMMFSFTWTGTYIFQGLKAFCESIDKTISDGLTRFYSNEYITLNVISKQLFDLQSQLLMKQFISSTTNDYLLWLQIIRDTTQANGLISALQTNYIFLYVVDKNIPIPVVFPVPRSQCDCSFSAKCADQSIIYDYSTPDFSVHVRGLYAGCLVLEGLLQSDLQCFYNQTCINDLQWYINSSLQMNFPALNSLLLNQFHQNSTIEELVNELMVEKWNSSSTYEDYYKECQPIKCTYQYVTKNGAIYIVTTVSGIIGGLITVLSFLVPRLVKFIPRLITLIQRKLRCSKVETEVTIQERNVQLFAKLKHYLLTLNLFSSVPPSTNEFHLRNERLSTRLFIISLVLSLVILITYTSFVDVAQISDVNAPTLTQYSYLYSKYSNTLTCPCTKVSIMNKRFLQVNYTLHQVCSSIFVRNDWITYLAATVQGEGILGNDFRWSGRYVFRGLKLLCESTDKILSDSLSRFYLNEYITLNVISKQLFDLQSQLLMKQFISSTTNDYLLSLQIIRYTTEVNAFYPATGNRYIFWRDPDTEVIRPSVRKGNNCTCIFSEKCLSQLAIYNYSLSFVANVPGLYAGCLVLEGLLQSDLQCFYNQTCINDLQWYINSSLQMNFPALNSLLLNQFHQNSTIEELVNELMVEKWNSSSTYEDYYKECQPIKCTYQYVTKNGAIYIVTTVSGIIGGLITVLSFLVPRLVKFIPRLITLIQRKLRCSKVETANNANQALVGLWQRFLDSARKFNLFPSKPPSTNEFDRRNQRISTRLFIIVLVLTMVVLLVYTSLINVTKTVTIKTPTLTEYSYLYSQHSQILICPCKKISIKYERFLQIQYTFHQVCSSLSFTETFIDSFRLTIFEYPLHYEDFRVLGGFAIDALASFCQLMNKTLSDGLTQFYSNQYVSAIVTSEQLFQIQAQSSFQQFVSSITDDLLLSLQMVRDTNQVNSLASGILTNYDFRVVSVPEFGPVEFIQPDAKELSGCSCMLSASCFEQVSIYDGENISKELFSVPGFNRGCFVVEALLQSTLECFYNQTCINILQSYMVSSPSTNISALDSSLISHYNESSTIEQLVNRLMVEDWNLSITYKTYYEECQPTECSYTYAGRNDAIYIATTIFGLVGGLVTILRLSVPALVGLIARLVMKRKSRIVSDMPIVFEMPIIQN